jgi:hypothetical protein
MADDIEIETLSRTITADSEETVSHLTTRNLK